MAHDSSSVPQADTRIFYMVHKTFRLATTRLVDATGKLPPSRLQSMIGDRWAFYAAVLHHHHHTEDDSFFPALLAVRPDLQPLIDKLAEDHRQMEAAIHDADTAVKAFEQDPDAAHQKTMHDAVVAVRDAFFPHLDIEDTQLIPAVTESMPASEFDRLDKQALRSIPKQYLSAAVGGLDEVIQDLPKDERPPPPPLPIRLMLALSWRKKWAVWVEPLLV